MIITGAGAGLGRVYALMYAKLGANVVVNDLNEKGANAVVEEITKGKLFRYLSFQYLSSPCYIAGGKAAAAICSAEDGDKIVAVALEKFGGVHVLVANAGILRDKSFQAMTKPEWDIVLQVHLRSTYKCAKAVWPIFQKQKYGRIVTTCSQVGICACISLLFRYSSNPILLDGNFGQANVC